MYCCDTLVSESSKVFGKCINKNQSFLRISVSLSFFSPLSHHLLSFSFNLSLSFSSSFIVISHSILIFSITIITCLIFISLFFHSSLFLLLLHLLLFLHSTPSLIFSLLSLVSILVYLSLLPPLLSLHSTHSLIPFLSLFFYDSRSLFLLHFPYLIVLSISSIFLSPPLSSLHPSLSFSYCSFNYSLFYSDFLLILFLPLLL